MLGVLPASGCDCIIVTMAVSISLDNMLYEQLKLTNFQDHYTYDLYSASDFK